MNLVHHALHSISTALREHPVGIGGTSLSWFGVIAAHEVLIDVWLKRGSMIFAIVASAVTVWSVIRRDNRESHQ